MKKFNFLIVALIVAVGFTACSKNDYEPYDYQKYLALEASMIEEYADSVANELGKEVVLDSTGIRYIIIEEGIQDEEEEGFYKYNGTTNALGHLIGIEAPRIRANYVGKVIPSGSVFDEENMKELKYFNLGTLVYAWQAAFFPKYIADQDGVLKYNSIRPGFMEEGLQKGAKIRIFTPSPYGYANQTNPGIPANSPLDFSIEVLEVKVPAATTN